VHYLLFILAFLWFAFIAPLKVTVAVCISLLIVTSVVKATASAVIGPSTYKEAFKSIGLAFVFMVVAGFTLISFTSGMGRGAPGLLVLCGFLAAYIFGFKFGLGASFGSSSIIAAVSTAVSGVLFFILKPMLS
jgi:hypothetical protein